MRYLIQKKVVKRYRFYNAALEISATSSDITFNAVGKTAVLQMYKTLQQNQYQIN